jgi:hypothetical protein
MSKLSDSHLADLHHCALLQRPPKPLILHEQNRHDFTEALADLSDSPELGRLLLYH